MWLSWISKLFHIHIRFKQPPSLMLIWTSYAAFHTKNDNNIINKFHSHFIIMSRLSIEALSINIKCHLSSHLMIFVASIFTFHLPSEFKSLAFPQIVYCQYRIWELLICFRLENQSWKKNQVHFHMNKGLTVPK